MRRIIRLLVVILILFMTVNVQGQIRQDMKNIIDTVIVKAKATALNSHAVKWDSIQLSMYESAKNAQSVKDLKPSFEVLINALNDPHGQIIDMRTKTGLAGFTNRNDDQQSGATTQTDLNAKFEYRVLDGGIGYLKIANIQSGMDVQKEAAIIRGAIDSLDKEQSKKWIIDLRYNNGDNIYPIIAGIAPLVGEGLVGSVVDGKNRITTLYEIHNANFYDNQHVVAKLPYKDEMNDARVAVLISGNTARAGEVLAITLKQRKNTRFFGEPTHGDLTNVSNIVINNDLTLSLSVSLYQDRKGNAYRNTVKPDMMIPFETASDTRHDKIIAGAIQWLKTESASTAMMNQNKDKSVVQ